MNAFWLTFALAFVVSATTARQDLKFMKILKFDKHNIVKCDTTGDQSKWKRLDSETVSAKGKDCQIVEQTINYPRDGVGKYDIVCIRVLDQIGDGTGGYPSILDGGIDFRYVTIHFESQKSYGFQFTVEIWGVDNTAGDN